MNTVAILGSGFGLYGYLPALALSGATPILLPARYQERFVQRPELARFANNIVWTPDEDSALRSANGVVLALCPNMQCTRLADCLNYSNIQYLLLEKPLAPNPTSAADWHAKLVASGKTFRLAYMFRFLDWAEILHAFCADSSGAGRVTIRWHFLAHHVRFAVDTWKRRHSLGGGAIRFYGIHLIALLAELGYSEAAYSSSNGMDSDEVNHWQAIFTGSDLPDCEIDLDCAASESLFSVSGNSPSGARFEIHRDDPFCDNSPVLPGTADRRVQPLIHFCQSAFSDCGQESVYRSTIQLWQTVEVVDRRRLTGTASAHNWAV